MDEKYTKALPSLCKNNFMDFDLKTTEYKDFVLEFHKTMLSKDLALIYEGEINQNLTKVFAGMAERSLEESQESTGTIKKVHHVVVECLQNICKHAEEDDSLGASSTRGIFMIRRLKDSFEITTGNIIEASKKEDIAELLTKVNSLNKDDLKDFYKKTLKASILSERGGAGLGFIDIAKKTGNKVGFHFEDIGEGKLFFILVSTVNRIA
jgi:hypothetical protein